MSAHIEPSESSEPDQPALGARAVEGVKREPGKTMIGAFVFGFILSLFPIGRIVNFVLSLGLLLLRPFLIFLGLVKTVEEVGKRQKK